MCHCALQVKDVLIVLTVQEMDLEAEVLTASEWEHLASLMEFLYPFCFVTKANEGLLDTIDRMLLAFEFLLGHFERLKQDYAGNQWMSIRIDAAWEKLTKYYAKSDDTAAYMTVTVLNPLHKWQWFEKFWGTNRALQQRLRKGKQDLRLHWLKHYADVTSVLMLTLLFLSSTTGAVTGFVAFLHRQDWALRNELEFYLGELCLMFTDQQRTLEFKVLGWWTEPAQQKQFPRLSKMVWDLLTVPVTSAEIECVFSECALSHSDVPLGMTPETLEQLMLHRSWERYVEKGGKMQVSSLFLSQILLTTYRWTLRRQWLWKMREERDIVRNIGWSTRCT